MTWVEIMIILEVAHNSKKSWGFLRGLLKFKEQSLVSSLRELVSRSGK